jgi:hypothetical protein
MSSFIDKLMRGVGEGPASSGSSGSVGYGFAPWSKKKTAAVNLTRRDKLKERLKSFKGRFVQKLSNKVQAAITGSIGSLLILLTVYKVISSRESVLVGLSLPAGVRLVTLDHIYWLSSTGCVLTCK